jgi:hypothetical protein
MCTTFVKCKIVRIVMLTVKSGIEPHMISWDTGLYGNGLDWNGLVRSIIVRLCDTMIKFGLVGHSETLWCD